MRTGKKAGNRSCSDRGYTLVELITVISIMVIMTGVASFGLSMVFSKDADYAAVKIDDALTEARTLAMSRDGHFVFVLHFGADPKDHYITIDRADTLTTSPVEYKRVYLEKSVNISVAGTNRPASGDIQIVFDKANGSMKAIGSPGTPASGSKAQGIYTFTVTSTKNTHKVRTVTLIATTGRHYTDK